jgi:cell fate (sporulation/competence/biofilm development) regulator YlbF (YheA/YmcA/DUF963 family)
MYEILNIKLNELLNLLDNNDIIKEYDKVKQEVLKNEKIKTLIFNFNNSEDIKDKQKFKQQLLEFDIYNEYKQLETEIYYLVLEINNKLNKLINKKQCLK